MHINSIAKLEYLSELSLLEKAGLEVSPRKRCFKGLILLGEEIASGLAGSPR